MRHEFMLPLERKRHLAEGCTDHRAKRQDFAPEAVIPDPDTRLLVVGRLLVIITRDADRQRIEIVAGTRIDMELLPAGIVGSLVPGIEIIHNFC